MNSVNQTRTAMSGMQGTQRAPQPNYQTTPQYGGPQQTIGGMPAAQPVPGQPTVNPSARVGMMGTRMGQAGQYANQQGVVSGLPGPQLPGPQAPTPFDPNDPRNAALAGYTA